ncbi:MAG: helix-turn-helix domain-containing protein [Chloroflexota bacterium]|nr:helix-turn-helix domain-containing protein [Chloroflexota bacterium]
MTLGAKLKQARLARGMSLTDVARLTGLSKGFLSQVETGATNPSLGSLHRLARALALSASDLVSTERDGQSTPVTPSPVRTSRPRLVRREQPARDRSTLKQIGSGSPCVIYLAHLLAESALEGLLPGSDLDACVLVLSGQLQFAQAGSTLRLFDGDSLTFSVGQHYRLSVQAGLGASLLLVLPSADYLPRLVEAQVGTAPRKPAEARLAATEFQGPLRLVAMRAARAAERGRRP